MSGYISLRTKFGNPRSFGHVVLLMVFAWVPLLADCSEALPKGARSVGTVVSMQGAWNVLAAGKEYPLAPGCSLPGNGVVISTSAPEEERSIYIQSPTLDPKGSTKYICAKTNGQCSLVLPSDMPGVISQLLVQVLRVFSGDPGKVTLALNLAGAPPDRVVKLENGKFDIGWFLLGVESGDYKLSFTNMYPAGGPAISKPFHWDGQQGSISPDGIRPGLYRVAISNPNRDAWMLLVNAGQTANLLSDDEASLRGLKWPPDTEIQQRALLRAFLTYGASQLENPR
jgi:hypothetical protein